MHVCDIVHVNGVAAVDSCDQRLRILSEVALIVRQD